MAVHEHKSDDPTAGNDNSWKRRFDEYLSADLGRYCAPIGWLPRFRAPATDLKGNTGTCALVDTGEIKAFVTCDHVWAAWVRYRVTNPSAKLLVGLGDGVPFDLSDGMVVDSDKGIDLAIITAKVCPERMGNKIFYPIREWPIPLPRVGELVAIVGFPGRGRESLGQRGTRWRMMRMTYGVSSVSERQITLAPERNDRVSYDENRNVVPHGPIGGMSGSPVFLLPNQGPSSLVGFVKEGKSSDDFIFLSPARCLQRNGSLRS